MAAGKLVVYLLRRDLRVSDNPVLHHLTDSSDHGYTHLLPVYVFPSQQMEVSGLLKDGHKSPYPQARSRVGGYWRCGPHRAKFVAQSVWDLRDGLRELNSGLVIRVGDIKDVLDHLIRGFRGHSPSVGAVWMMEELSSEEVEEQDAVAAVCSENGVEFKLWPDEKYFIDDRDTGLARPEDLPDVFTTYRKTQEPLRQRPRKALARPGESCLPPLPEESTIPPQHGPFEMPDSLDDLEARLVWPLDDVVPSPPQFPDGAKTGHPFRGGESHAHDRLGHLIKSGAMTSYKKTRNGLLGLDFSTKLSGYLALGCISARQIHEELVKFEDGTDEAYEGADGYGKGENEGTAAIRLELLWRDYMRLCMAKFGRKLFSLSGFTQDASCDKKWKTANEKAAGEDQEPSPEEVSRILERFQAGTTGMGLIDATQRELLLTGYTSNRARQNAASFLSKHLNIDWRYGAEWYEMLLIDYDVSSNWANWQYMAGVGNDPRGDARIFNPVKQAFDYDKDGAYVRTWVPELRDLEKPENVFQVWTASSAELQRCGLAENIMVTDPVKRIDFAVDRKPKGGRRPFSRRRGPSRGGRRDGTSGGHGLGQGRPAKAAEASPGGGGGQPGPEAKAQQNQNGSGSAPQDQDGAQPPRRHHSRGEMSSRGTKYSSGPHATYAPNGYNGYGSGYGSGYSNGYRNGYGGYGGYGGFNGGFNGGSWYGDHSSRGRGGYPQFRGGGGRWYGQRGGFRGGYHHQQQHHQQQQQQHHHHHHHNHHHHHHQQQQQQPTRTGGHRRTTHPHPPRRARVPTGSSERAKGSSLDATSSGLESAGPRGG